MPPWWHIFKPIPGNHSLAAYIFRTIPGNPSLVEYIFKTRPLERRKEEGEPCHFQSRGQGCHGDLPQAS